MPQFESYTNKFFDTDFMKGMMPASLFPFDISALMDMQRKNMQTFGEIHQTNVENLQAIVQLQTEMLSQVLQNNTNLVQQVMAEGTPEEKVARQADLVKQAYEDSISSLTDLSDMVAKSGKETGDIINKRVTASLTEFKSSMEKSRAKTSKAA